MLRALGRTLARIAELALEQLLVRGLALEVVLRRVVLLLTRWTAH